MSAAPRPIPGYIRGILKALEARGDQVRPGDVIMHNDAYGGASHGPDVAFAVERSSSASIMPGILNGGGGMKGSRSSGFAGSGGNAECGSVW